MTSEDFSFFTRHTHDTPDFLFELDEYRRPTGEQLLLAHIRVHTFTKEVLRRMLHEWRTLRKCVRVPVFAHADVDDDKWKKFVTLMGFKYLQPILCTDGVERSLYIHTI